MKQTQIAFIGGGNMANALIGGLVAGGAHGADIHVTDPDRAKLDALHQRYGVQTGQDNPAAVAAADVVVLAVKPQVLHSVAVELASVAQTRRPLVVSIAAGIRTEAVARWIGGTPAIVRAMPNTPAMVQCGATALFATAPVSALQRDQAESILRTVGLTLWLDDEAQMDAVTALSGSGPAYIFLIMEAMEEAGRALGLPAEMSRLLTLETAFGAAKMALESPDGAATLRQRVTSPGGTTEQALKVLEQGGVRDLFTKALAAAARRSRELADSLGAQ